METDERPNDAECPVVFMDKQYLEARHHEYEPSIAEGMMSAGPDFRNTWLWRHAFECDRSDSSTDEQVLFREQYLLIRARATHLTSQIAAALPEMTVHDISHSDALWDTASVVAEGAMSVNPPEAFVLGASMLLHDAAMSIAAYPRGIDDVKAKIVWKDAIARAALAANESGEDPFDPADPPDAVVRQILPDVLRRLHAEHAEVLAEQSWVSADGRENHIIEDSDLRMFYGPMIGRIAHSHWWPVHKIENEFSEPLGALAGRTTNRIDAVKIACILRVADALHLDSRRAPRFLRAITTPRGVSSLHWKFQERLSRPHIEFDSVVFTSGPPFERSDAEAWWLMYDTINAVDRELREVDLLLQSTGRESLKAIRVKGAGSTAVLSQTVRTRGWCPVETGIQVSDVPQIVKNLGGSRLYGDDPTVALRELIQNAADAVQARRKLQRRPADWGNISVGLPKKGEDFWLIVEDNGVGMSEAVLTGPLLDFGSCFWRSQLATEEFPGLLSAGMDASGRFGIGFFSVFMLGTIVRVYSRRYDKGTDSGRLLEFRSGLGTRPILSFQDLEGVPIEGGTRIEVQLRVNPHKLGGLLRWSRRPNSTISLSELVGMVARSLDVSLTIEDDGETRPVTKPQDWLELTPVDLVRRLNPDARYDPFLGSTKVDPTSELMRPLCGADGTVFGRAYIKPSTYHFQDSTGWVTIAGLRSGRLDNLQGILLGEAVTAARKSGVPIVPQESLSYWASEQGKLICQFVHDEERQAESAEIILECGGEIGNLKIVQLGYDWLSVEEFDEELQNFEELVVEFGGEFEYDEDSDDVHPRDFRRDFELSDDVAIVFKYSGAILNTGSTTWPNTLTGQPKPNESRIGELIRERIERVWGADYGERVEHRVVGTVGSEEITREVTVFYAT